MSFAQFVSAVQDSGTPAAPPASGDLFDSDDFSGGIGAWTQVDSLADSTFSGVGTSPNIYAQIDVASGASHVPESPYSAPKLMKAANSVDFTVILKLVAALSTNETIFGMEFYADASNRVHLHTYRGGGVNTAEIIRIVGGVRTSIGSTASGSATYLRMVRSGNDWTGSFSSDGSSWTTLTGFTQAYTITQAGMFAGNFGSNPAFTAQFDWIEDSADPITSEDP